MKNAPRLVQCLHHLFSQQVRKSPDAVAVVDSERSLSFRELDRESDRLAAVLQEKGLGPDDTVGLYLPKTADYIVACFAALKAGGAFLPLFLDTPPSQLAKIIEQTQSKVIVSDKLHAERLPNSALQPSLVLLDERDQWPECSLKDPEVGPENLMFVVYTSGTTGEPKGIALPHRAAFHSYEERHRFNPYKPGQRVACNIFFVWEFFRPLIRGATVHVIPDHIIYDPKPLAKFLSEGQITEVLFTPSLMETLLNHLREAQWKEELSNLEVIWLNGEVVTEELRAKALKALPPSVKLLNTYSISECHDVANSDLRAAATSPTGFCRVGYPIEGIQVQLFSEDLQVVETGENGEIFVGGPGLARGYVQRPHLTAERFVEVEGTRFYRTGDFGVQYEDGLLEIRGRCDSMVKIRGYSVHLGAVHSALEALDSVKAAAVVAIGKEGRDKRLVAYVVGTEDKDWSISSLSCSSPQLRELLRESLPEFMLPNLFWELETLPLSPSTGKFDSKLLPPLPERPQASLEDLKLSATPDRDEKLKMIVQIWERILGLDPGVVHSESNFFDLGGHSLMAVRVVQSIERIFGDSPSVKQLYENPTVKQLTNLIHEGKTDSEESIPCSEWKLDSSISYRENLEAVPLNEAKAILVTGATGFLGAFILGAVQELCDCPIYVLVRPGEGSVQQRLEANLRSLKIEPSAQIRALAGDLSKEKLGLSADDYQMLSREVELVFHSGAAVNYVHSYSILKPHTVKGTEEILRLCASEHGRGKSLHYISTNGIFGGQQRYLEDDDIDPYFPHLENGYGQSKWVAEKLVRQAVQRGLNATIYRPGNIGHHSQTGAVNLNDFQYLLIKACLKVGKAPKAEDWFLEMTPVDALSGAIAKLACKPATELRTFNIVQNPTTKAAELWERLLAAKKLTEMVSMEEWIDLALKKAREEQDSKMEVLANSLTDVEGYLTDQSHYDGKNLQAAIEQQGLPWPKADLGYLEMLC